MEEKQNENDENQSLKDMKILINVQVLSSTFVIIKDTLKENHETEMNRIEICQNKIVQNQKTLPDDQLLLHNKEISQIKKALTKKY